MRYFLIVLYSIIIACALHCSLQIIKSGVDPIEQLDMTESISNGVVERSRKLSSYNFCQSHKEARVIPKKSQEIKQRNCSANEQ
jgi:hypothetical protein